MSGVLSLDVGLRWLYDHAPVAGQNAMCTVAGHVRNWQRYDRQFADTCKFFAATTKWQVQDIADYQLHQLQRLFAHCVETVPYYRERLTEKDSPVSFGDWRRLDTLSKDDVRLAGTTLLASSSDVKSLVVSKSGGSTGMPLRCYHDADALKRVYAFHWAVQRPGVSRHDRYATFQGVPIIPTSQQAGPYWRTNHAMRQRLYSIFHLSEQTIGDYVADLDKYRPVYLSGYANSLYLLATLAEETGQRPAHAPIAVFSTSEQLSSSHRATIERVFRTRVWDAYSQDETCGSITQYECGFYHYDRGYGYMEFEDLELLQGNRRLAEIICTGFLNRAWPLLRYRPGDLVEYEPCDQCPKCGRAGPVIHAIRGRTGDVILLPSGRRFPHISLVVKNLAGIRQVQLVQHAIDRITIRFVPTETYDGDVHLRRLRESFSQAMGEGINWETEAVSVPARTAAGKFKSIISHLPDGAKSCQSRGSAAAVDS